VLAAAVRDPAVRVVPPHGLCLEEVGYPPPAELAARAATTRTLRTRLYGVDAALTSLERHERGIHVV
jgi:tRNA pseudouridine38-40 synthase